MFGAKGDFYFTQEVLFAPNQETQIVAFDAIADRIDEGLEFVKISIMSATNGVEVAAKRHATIYIEDQPNLCGPNNDCNGHGTCINGECSCNCGYGGPSCTEYKFTVILTLTIILIIIQPQPCTCTNCCSVEVSSIC